MIKYVEKGVKLHQKVAAAGHRMLEVTDAETGKASWVTDDDSAVQSIIDAYSLDETKAEVIENMEAKAKELRDLSIEGVSAAELALRGRKVGEARTYSTTNDPASAPFLDQEAQLRGIFLSALVEKVLRKADEAAELEAQIAGILGKHKDFVRMQSSFSAVLSYDFSQGWPVVE